MSELTIELDRLIQKAALDGALTQKAVDMFHTMLKENEELRKDLEKQNKDLDKMQKERDLLSTDLGIAHGLNTVAAAAEVAMIERELKMTTLELTAEHMAERVKDHKEMFKVVFRNSVLRKEVMTPNESHTEATGASHSTFSSKETVEEEEK